MHNDRDGERPPDGMIRVTATLMVPGRPDEQQEVWVTPGLLGEKEAKDEEKKAA